MLIIVWKKFSPIHKTSQICLNLSTSSHYRYGINDMQNYIKNYVEKCIRNNVRNHVGNYIENYIGNWDRKWRDL